ncbi:hypothetical protein [Parasitella parasitica]|uniref:Uncharacterized protein n=1 Tax=Parasitella parasitica TaxID=35722 RepID=A0A0B7N0T6_9FUNG|nr:hypothetical protein [Parasitella parasitica]
MEDAHRKLAMAEQCGNDPRFRTLDTDIGLVLDQEKTYDGVNLVYLKSYKGATEIWLPSEVGHLYLETDG